MAQEISYFENYVKYTEGPFVIVNPWNNGWRIEVELKGHKCPVLPDLSIYQVMKSLGLSGKTFYKDHTAEVCDELNKMVREGKIVLDEKGWWVVKPDGPQGDLFMR